MSVAHFLQGSTSVASAASIEEREFTSTSESKPSEITHKGRGPTALTPVHLLRSALHGTSEYGYNQDTIVNSAWYGKQTTSVRHEFILIQVENQSIPGSKKYLVLDRTVGQASQANVERTTSLWTLSVGTDALDSFWVLNDAPGDKEQLLSGCRLDSHELLERIDFQSDQPLELHFLAWAARNVSSAHPKYHPLVANCFWFAGLIWEWMRRRPGAKLEVLIPGKRGRISLMRILPKSVQAGKYVYFLKTPSPGAGVGAGR